MADANTEKMELMIRYQLTMCSWDSDGNITCASRVAEKPAPVHHPRQARDMAAMIAARRQQQHAVAFAHASVKPKLDEAPSTNAVPRAVRAKQAPRGTEVG